MSTPIFPTSLPTISQLSLQSISNVITDESTVKNFRRISRVPNANDKVQWTLFNDQLKIFIDFYKITLLDGHKWFYIKLPSAKGIVYHIARFKSMQANVIGHKAWTVDAELELRERAFEVIEPIVDPEPPTGEPDVFSFLLMSNGSSYAPNQSRVDTTDFGVKAEVSSADYAVLNTSNGQITVNQTGVYELRFSIAFAGSIFLTDNSVTGADVSLNSLGDSDASQVFPFSFPLTSNGAVGAGGPSYPTAFCHKIINIVTLETTATIVIEPFAGTEAETGTYIINSIAGSLQRLGDAIGLIGGD